MEGRKLSLSWAEDERVTRSELGQSKGLVRKDEANVKNDDEKASVEN